MACSIHSQTLLKVMMKGSLHFVQVLFDTLFPQQYFHQSCYHVCMYACMYDHMCLHYIFTPVMLILILLCEVSTLYK